MTREETQHPAEDAQPSPSQRSPQATAQAAGSVEAEGDTAAPSAEVPAAGGVKAKSKRRRTDQHVDPAPPCGEGSAAPDEPTDGAAPALSSGPESESESDNEEHDLLVCQQCKFPLAYAADIVMERAEQVGAMVYHYPLELDMCSQEIPCYSSDNQHGMRFDVVRVKPHSYITAHGPESDTHSFFPGYAWTCVSCGRCSKHLGWGFTPTPVPAVAAAVAAAVLIAALEAASPAAALQVEPAPSATEGFDYSKTFDFFGLILTKMSPGRRTKHDVVDERGRMHEDVVDFNPTVMLTDVMRMVRQLHSATYAGGGGASASTLAEQLMQAAGFQESDDEEESTPAAQDDDSTN